METTLVRERWTSWDNLCVLKKFGGLAFKNLHAFNIAMLGKQAWRLVMDPTSLVSRIYKARYYHSTSFLEARYGSNPSYIWRSILAAQHIIRDGIRVRIGDGTATEIWHSAWLPAQDNGYVTTAP